MNRMALYSPGDYCGATGVESYYEDKLRGTKGSSYILKDNLGREIESLDEGRMILWRYPVKTWCSRWITFCRNTDNNFCKTKEEVLSPLSLLQAKSFAWSVRQDMILMNYHIKVKRRRLSAASTGYFESAF